MGIVLLSETRLSQSEMMKDLGDYILFLLYITSLDRSKYFHKRCSVFLSFRFYLRFESHIAIVRRNLRSTGTVKKILVYSSKTIQQLRLEEMIIVWC